MIPRLANRTPRTRAVRLNSGDPRLESLAAEFALLAQRRSRAVHQLETLDQQRAAAAMGFAKLQKRITWLMERMNTLSAEPQEAAEFQPEPVRPAPVRQGLARQGPVRQDKIAAAAQGADALAEIGRRWAATQPAVQDHFTPPRRTRRP